MAAALGAAYTLDERGADTVPLLTQALEQSTTTARAHYETLCSFRLGEVHMLAGRLEEAQVLAERALVLAGEHQERGHRAYALRLLGAIHAQRHPPEVALADASYQQALALANALGMRPLQAHCYRGLGVLYSRVGRGQQARASLCTAIALYRAMEMAFWLPQAEAALGHVCTAAQAG